MPEFTDHDQQEEAEKKPLTWFLQGLQRLETRIQDFKGSKKELMSQAKKQGFDLTQIRLMLKLAKMDPTEREAFLAKQAAYAKAAGMPFPEPGYYQELMLGMFQEQQEEDNIREFDPVLTETVAG